MIGLLIISIISFSTVSFGFGSSSGSIFSFSIFNQNKFKIKIKMNQILENLDFDNSSIRALSKYILEDPESTQKIIDESGYMDKLWDFIQNKDQIVEQSMVIKNYIALATNLITGNQKLQKKYFHILAYNTPLITKVFDLAWNEFEDLETSQIGEICLKNLLVFIYNCSVYNHDLLADFSSKSDFIYRVHRYIYTAEQYAKEEKEEVTQELTEISEWYTLLIKMVIKVPDTTIMLNIYNGFISKKDKKNNEIITHISGLKLIKSDQILKVTKDQLLLMSFIKHIFEETIKDEKNFIAQYQKNCKNLIDEKIYLNFANVYLANLIDIFNAYYTDEKIVKNIYVDKSLSENDLLDFLETIKCIYDIFTQITAFGESADHFKGILSDFQDCLILKKSGELMSKLKQMVDFLIQIEVYKPQEKFKKTIGMPHEDQDMENHPFSGFISSIVCLSCNLTYYKNSSIESYFLSEKGWNHLGQILANTKLDIDNPSLREWSILFVRNMTSWSNEIREKLAKLTLIDSKNPHDAESQKTLDALGKPMQEMYKKEMEKYKKDEEDQEKLMECLKRAHNVDVVDF